MLHWAAGAFDITGIQNEARGKRGIETIEEMRDWVMTKVTPGSLKPDGLVARNPRPDRQRRARGRVFS